MKSIDFFLWWFLDFLEISVIKIQIELIKLIMKITQLKKKNYLLKV